MSKEYFDFCDENLLTFDELVAFIEAYPNEKAITMSDQLLSYYNIVNNTLYIYDDATITYKKIEQPTYEYLAMMSRKLIFSSFTRLSVEQKASLEKRYKDELGIKCKLLFTMDYYKEFVHDVFNLINKSSFHESYLNRKGVNDVHYRNGYINTKTNVFKQRNSARHFITQYLDIDYEVKEEEDDDEDDVDASVDSVSEDEGDAEIQFKITKKEIRRIVDLI